MTMRSDTLLTISGIAAGATIASLLYYRAKFAKWERALGIVTEMRGERDRDGYTLRVPVIRFTPAGFDREVEFEESVRSSFSFLQRGYRIEILYDPQNPTSAIIAGWRQYFLPFFCGVATVITFFAGLRP